jgi:hypothetical protein
MVIDRFTKFILSVIAFSLCLNALNPWVSPNLVEAAGSGDDMDISIKKIARELETIASGAVIMSKVAKNYRLDKILEDKSHDSRYEVCYITYLHTKKVLLECTPSRKSGEPLNRTQFEEE